MKDWLTHFEAIAKGLGPPGREVVSAVKTVADVIQGRPAKVSQGEYDTRLAKCFKCRSMGMFMGSQQCRKCGCFIRVKAWLKEFHCELGEW